MQNLIGATGLSSQKGTRNETLNTRVMTFDPWRGEGFCLY